MSSIRLATLLAITCLWACLVVGCGDDKACADQSPSECDADACRVFTAARLDAEGDCLRMDVAACAELPEEVPACDQAVMNTASPEGECWKFYNGCLPEGFGLSAACQMEFAGKERCPVE